MNIKGMEKFSGQGTKPVGVGKIMCVIEVKDLDCNEKIREHSR